MKRFVFNALLAKVRRRARILDRLSLIFLAGCFSTVAPAAILPASAATLPAGTHLEVRLSVPTGSRISHKNDVVEATLIAPVYSHGRLLIAQGATVSGIVENVQPLGYGIKHLVSTVEYRFNALHLPTLGSIPIEARVAEIETAREHVDAGGVTEGMYPMASLSSGVEPYLLPVLCLDPQLGLTFWGIKVVIARSPDPEIVFPVGTEAILELTADAAIPEPATPLPSIPPISETDLATARQVLVNAPQQRTSRSHQQPSDLVNLLFLGSSDSISRAFHATGWSGAQRCSIMVFYRMYQSMVLRKGYHMAPMGRLTLNGLTNDAEYQKSLDTFAKRHHARLWRQGNGNAWLSAATEDINYQLRNMHLTHATDPAIDNERNKVLNDMAFTGCVESATFLDRDIADRRDPPIKTDGAIAVLRINDCQNPRKMDRDVKGDRLWNRPRPTQVLVALRNDLIRANPAFLAYDSGKLLWQHAFAVSRFASRAPGRQETKLARNSMRPEWIRPSVLDSQTRITR